MDKTIKTNYSISKIYIASASYSQHGIFVIIPDKTGYMEISFIILF